MNVDQDIFLLLDLFISPLIGRGLQRRHFFCDHSKGVFLECELLSFQNIFSNAYLLLIEDIPILWAGTSLARSTT